MLNFYRIDVNSKFIFPRQFQIIFKCIQSPYIGCSRSYRIIPLHVSYAYRPSSNLARKQWWTLICALVSAHKLQHMIDDHYMYHLTGSEERERKERENGADQRKEERRGNSPFTPNTNTFRLLNNKIYGRVLIRLLKKMKD